MAVIYEWREIRCIRRRLMGVGYVPYSGHGDRADEGACGVGDLGDGKRGDARRVRRVDPFRSFGAAGNARRAVGVAGREDFICAVWELLGAEGLAQRLPYTDCGRSEKAFPAGASHAKRDKPEHEKRRPLMVGGVCGLRPKGN